MCFFNYFFKKKYFFKCPVCYLNEKNVAILNCGHGVCYRCLLSIFKITRELYKIHNITRRNLCPMCRNTILRHEIGIIENKKCVKCNKNNLLTKCKECNYIICKKCYFEKNECYRCKNKNITNIYID